jgi:hypothetical protein
MTMIRATSDSAQSAQSSSHAFDSVLPSGFGHDRLHGHPPIINLSTLLPSRKGFLGILFALAKCTIPYPNPKFSKIFPAYFFEMTLRQCPIPFCGIDDSIIAQSVFTKMNHRSSYHPSQHHDPSLIHAFGSGLIHAFGSGLIHAFGSGLIHAIFKI